jgi:chloramphenicol-sensitive protein RarD
MEALESKRKRRESASGVIYAGAAFLIWGVGPIYWKALAAVSPVEIICHRVIWSFVFLLILIIATRRWQEFRSALKSVRILLTLASTAAILTVNWLIYVWAINHAHILQGSLGYYINPLINVVFGVLLLRERLRPLQVLAVVTAGAGVVYLTFSYGELPWIALALACAFGLYGLIRKVAPVGPLVGLGVETMLLAGPAAAYLAYSAARGNAAFLHKGTRIDLLLLGTSLLTAVPLILFTAGARRINLSTLGLMQYIAPTGIFLLGVLYYHEPFSTAKVWTFIMIWTALAVYSTDSILCYRRMGR